MLPGLQSDAHPTGPPVAQLDARPTGDQATFLFIFMCFCLANEQSILQGKIQNMFSKMHLLAREHMDTYIN